MPRIENVLSGQVSPGEKAAASMREREGTVHDADSELTSMDSMRLRLEGELVAELKKLDLSANESRILLFLMSNGSSTASDIARYTKIQRTDTYHYISTLLSKGVIFSTFSKPQKYYSMPYEEVIDYLVQAKTNALREVSERKIDCRTKLEQIAKCVTKEESEDSYQVLAGENVIFARTAKMLSGPTKKISIFLSDRMLAKFYHEGVIDQLAAISKAGASVRIKTPSKRALDTETDLDEESSHDGGSEAKQGLRLETISEPTPASFFIVDDSKVLFIIDRRDGKTKDITGIFTNNQMMISTLAYLFERIV